MFTERSLPDSWFPVRQLSGTSLESCAPMEGSTAEKSKLLMLLLLTGYHWRPLIGAQDSIRILDANYNIP
jgi:hypothetical protein